MKADERRQRILMIMETRDSCLNAAELARELGVSRQVIVSDVAILRERGKRILSTPRGYLLDGHGEWGYIGVVFCRHDRDGVLRELYLVVDNGGAVLDLAVQHPIYGLISAQLNIRSRYDADQFVRRSAASDATLLSSLTDGLHLHHIGTHGREDFERIRAALVEADLLAHE